MMRWIVVDMDGTLLNSQKIITDLTKETIIDMQKSGYRFILASGRPTSGMLQYAKQLDMDKYNGVVISYNGSLAMNVQNQEILFHKPLSTIQSKRILHHLKQFDVDIMIDKDEYMFVHDVYADNIQHESRMGCYKLCEVDDLEAACQFPLNKILISAKPCYLKQHFQEMAEPFSNEVHSMFTAPYYYEFNALGVDKATALKHVISFYGSDRTEVIVFGDAHNDITMMQFAGTGVAMGNVVSEVKNIADIVTDTNDNDGIVQALKELKLCL